MNNYKDLMMEGMQKASKARKIQAKAWDAELNAIQEISVYGGYHYTFDVVDKISKEYREILKDTLIESDIAKLDIIKEKRRSNSGFDESDAEFLLGIETGINKYKDDLIYYGYNYEAGSELTSDLNSWDILISVSDWFFRSNDNAN